MIGRQSGIGCMRYLVEVVADAFELIDERDWQGVGIGRRVDHDRPVFDQVIDVPRPRQSEPARLL